MGTMITLTLIGSCVLATVAKVVEVRIKRRHIGVRLVKDA